MNFEIMTNADTVRRVIHSTIFSVVVAVGVTVLGMVAVFGFDPDAMVSVRDVFKFGIVAPTVLSLLVCPWLSYPTICAIRDRNQAQRELQRLSGTDQLTNLLNRRGFDAAAKAALETADKSGLAVLIFDIDRFKKVNDDFGHAFGDAALVHVAGILRDLGQKYAFTVGRQGGEEFIALLTGTTAVAALSIAERIRAACAEHPVVHDGRLLLMTISIGVAASGTAGAALSELAARADAALYVAKRSGRNRVYLAEPVMSLSTAA